VLTENDRKAIRQIIQEELKEALFRTITIERGPRQQGDPEKVVKEETWHVLDFLAAYMPKIEAALRGMQEDVDRAANSAARQEDRVAAIGQVLLGIETAAKRLAAFSDYVRALEAGGERHTDTRHDN
jgi:hypothetical protein